MSYKVAITPATLTISGVAATDRTYDGTNAVALTGGTLSGVVDGDTVDFTLGSGIAASKNAGTQNVTTAITLSGADAGNYQLTQPTGVTVNISKATLTITAENKTIITGSQLPAYTAAYTGFAGSDNKASVIKTDAALTCAATDGNTNGSYQITPANAEFNTGYDANYTISYVPGTLTISDKTAAGVTLTGVPTAAKTYGDSAFTVTASAASAGTNGAWTWTSSDPDVLSVSGSGAAVTVTILKSGSAKLTASYSSDTTVGQAESTVITVNKASLIVRPKSISVTTGAAMPAPEVEYAGLKNSDTAADVTLSGGTLAMQIQNGKGAVLADTKTAGSYPIVFTGSPVFNVSDKYMITVTTGKLTVSAPAPAGGGASADTVTVPASSDAGSVSVDAKVDGDAATVAPTDAQIAAVASSTKETGTVQIDLTSLKVDTAVLPEKLVSAAQKADAGAGLAVILPTGRVELDKTALNAVAGKGDMELSVKVVPTSNLTPAQKTVLGNQKDSALVVDVKMLTDGKETTSFAGGQLTIRVPYTLKSGEDASRLIVWYLKADGTLEPHAASYDAKTGTVTFITTHLSRYFIASFPFTDVAESSYCYTAVAWASGSGITEGKTATTFDPYASCTRAQVVTFLWRAMGSPEPAGTANPFTDVSSDAYYYKAVLWAVEKGITKGTTNTTFDPDATVTRAQAVTFQYRAAGTPEAAAANPFSDVASGAYYTDAVLWAVNSGVTKGTSATAFSPAQTCTRDQIVTFLWRQFGI